MYMGVVLYAHPLHGESHIKRNVNVEVATTSLWEPCHSKKKQRKNEISFDWTMTRACKPMTRSDRSSSVSSRASHDSKKSLGDSYSILTRMACDSDSNLTGPK